MAAVNPHDYIRYYKNLVTDYEVPNIVFGDPSNRKIRVNAIGAGVANINLAYHLQRFCANYELAIYELHGSLGGTWHVNRYPGAACDVPSHVYQYTLALNPDWPRYNSFADEISAYLDEVCEVCDLKKYMTFNTECVGAEWEDSKGIWKVTLRQTALDGRSREFADECDILVNSTGLHNKWQWPKIEGLDSFKGRLIHTARWPEEYQKAQWRDETAAVIGGGASSVQVVPAMQPHVKSMQIYVRRRIWFVGLGMEAKKNEPYTNEDIAKFRTASELVAHGKKIEHDMNQLFFSFYKGGLDSLQGQMQARYKERTKELIKDKRLLEGFNPKFQLGCRRVTFGDPFIEAIHEPNVAVHFASVVRLTENGVIDSHGDEKKFDTVICATGFDVSYRPLFPIIGKDGVNLQDKWARQADSYMGVAVAGFPNFFPGSGPYWPIANGSLMSASNAVSQYIVQAVQKLQTHPNIRSLSPTQKKMEDFATHCQEWYKSAVWSDTCPSWYKNRATGRVQAVWPGIALHFVCALNSVRWEDYECSYHRGLTGLEDNPFSYLGRGLVLDVDEPSMDDSPHLNVDGIDAKWATRKGIQNRRSRCCLKSEYQVNSCS